MGSAACLIKYLDLMAEPTNFGAFQLQHHHMEDYMKMDASAVRALNLLPSPQDQGNKTMSLFGLLNRCKTAMGTPGLSDDRLVALGEQAGGGPGFAACVQSGRYAPWTAEVTDQASKDGLAHTPTVKVDGKEIDDPTPDAVRAAVAG